VIKEGHKCGQLKSCGHWKHEKDGKHSSKQMEQNNKQA
jgi:hypothetical protein